MICALAVSSEMGAAVAEVEAVENFTSALTKSNGAKAPTENAAVVKRIVPWVVVASTATAASVTAASAAAAEEKVAVAQAVAQASVARNAAKEIVTNLTAAADMVPFTASKGEIPKAEAKVVVATSEPNEVGSGHCEHSEWCDATWWGL
jgi:hypothetical protein